MEIASVGASTSNPSSELDRAGLGQEDFLEILLTQLTFQDPLEPMDNQEFVAQMAQFTSLEQAKQSNDKMEDLLSIQSSTQSLGLLNKTVEVAVSNGTDIGEITTVSFDSGVPNFTVKKADGEFLTGVSLSQIKLVR